ncbi:hypothetical protein [Sinomonas sp. P47F7]|uniref:hypothetical protein n=1 Tax=Sinomonas sp. P47F7 TaxID=3410987 RepID=UPI003BF51584
MIFEDGPTPILSYAGEGIVEIHWLVGGQSVELAIAPDHSICVTAFNSSGDVTLDEEFVDIDSFEASSARNRVILELRFMSRLLLAAGRRGA